MSNLSEKHYNTKIILTIGDFQEMVYNQSDNVRIEMIKNIIYTAPDCYAFWNKITNVLSSKKFEETLD